jgi:hypothetical protein
MVSEITQVHFAEEWNEVSLFSSSQASFTSQVRSEGTPVHPIQLDNFLTACNQQMSPVFIISNAISQHRTPAAASL